MCWLCSVMSEISAKKASHLRLLQRLEAGVLWGGLAPTSGTRAKMPWWAQTRAPACVLCMGSGFLPAWQPQGSKCKCSQQTKQKLNHLWGPIPSLWPHSLGQSSERLTQIQGEGDIHISMDSPLLMESWQVTSQKSPWNGSYCCSCLWKNTVCHWSFRMHVTCE